jgi:hypothetical protein
MTTDDLANYLEVIARCSVLTYLPDQQDDVVMARFTGGGRDPELVTVHEPSFQVLIRKTNAVEAEALARKIETELHGKCAGIGGRKCLIYSKHDPADLGEDQKKRKLFSLNFEMIYQT